MTKPFDEVVPAYPPRQKDAVDEKADRILSDDANPSTDRLARHVEKIADRMARESEGGQK